MEECKVCRVNKNSNSNIKLHPSPCAIPIIMPWRRRAFTITLLGVTGWYFLSSFRSTLIHNNAASSFVAPSLSMLSPMKIPRHPTSFLTKSTQSSEIFASLVLHDQENSQQLKNVFVEWNSVASNQPIEDRYHIQSFDGGVVVGVVDGHSGYECSDYINQQLPIRLIEAYQKNQHDSSGNWIKDVFLNLDQELIRVPPLEDIRRGMAGAVVAECIYAHDLLWVAHTGDVRIVMGTSDGRSKRLTHDHNAMNMGERERIQREHPQEPISALLRNNRILGSLAPTRAFGDARFKWSHEQMQTLKHSHSISVSKSKDYKTPPYVTAEPEISRFSLEDGDEFIIIASDGVWDDLSDDEAVQIVLASRSKKSTDASQLPSQTNSATRLIQGAISKSAPGDYGKNLNDFVAQNLAISADRSRRYRDDQTVCVLWFKSSFLTAKL